MNALISLIGILVSTIGILKYVDDSTVFPMIITLIVLCIMFGRDMPEQ